MKPSILGAALLALAGSAHAATPASGSVSGSSATVTWEGAPKTSTAGSCTGPTDATCDHFTLTVTDPGFPFRVNVQIDVRAQDWDLIVFDAAGKQVDSSGNLATQTELVVLTAPGTYTISAAPFVVAPGLGYGGSATLVRADAAPVPAPNGGANVRFRTFSPPGLGEPDPEYAQFAPARGDSGIGASAGEPTLGIPHVRNRALQATQPDKSRIMYIANLQTLRLEVDDTTSPPVGTWANKSCISHVETLDPILMVDPDSGRTISTQLNAKRSLMCLSNDDGDTWVQSPQGAGINAGVDHQTLGSGPYPAGDTLRLPDALDPARTYPTATYYASQDVAIAQAALSRDGGFTWGLAVPMYNLTQCGGLHGHAQVGPDGAVYVPNGNCPIGQAGFARSLDAGNTWTVHAVPGTVSDDDPGMALGRGDEVPGGRAFFGVCQNGKAVVSTSDDRGETWSPLLDVGTPAGLANCTLPTLIAGDDDRAAFVFLGSTTGGSASGGDDPALYDGTWYLYVAMTYDGGASWTTINVTPGDPVQRGPVCLLGPDCASYRNLLDFNDVQLDEKGRVYIAYADGCIGNCVQQGPNSLTAIARIARQDEGSRSLYAAFDHVLAPSAAAPKMPFAEAFRRAGGGVDLKWTKPYDGNSAITEYRVFRRDGSAGFGTTPLAAVQASSRSYFDATAPATATCYRVVAVNAVGASTGDFEACATAPVATGDRCIAPGLILAEDRGNAPLDSTPLGLRGFFGGEPFLGDPLACDLPAVARVEFNVDVGAPLQPGNAVILLWNRQTGSVPSRIALAQPDDRNMISVRMVGTTPQCRFGHVTGSATTSPLPSHGYDISAPFPAADCKVVGSRVTVRVDPAVIDDGAVGPGYSFGGLEARVFPAQPVANATLPKPVLQTTATDFLVAANFALAGNESCRPDYVPIAAGDTVNSDFRRPLTIDVLANDSANGDCDTLQITGTTTPAYGTVRIVGDRLEYTPRTRKRVCTDEFAYTISDGNGNSAKAVVTVRNTRGCPGREDRDDD